ncbi:MAG: hypothetical protein JSR48_03735 [Verrucomicrobia bacterium]|nr:hypothetical protein [Verrucomicrobiota bacterium]
MRIRWPFLLVFLLTLCSGVVLWLQRQYNDTLRGEVALLQTQHQELLRLRNEHARLAAARVSPERLAAIRSDHAATERLHAEIDRLSQKVREIERDEGR